MGDTELKTLECLESELIRYKKEDLMKKMEITANILKKCELCQYLNPKLRTPMEKISYLTGVTQLILGHVHKMPKKCKDFANWMDGERRNRHGHFFDYIVLRNTLIENYTKRFQIPTTLKTSKAYEGYMKYYTSLQIPGTKKSIVVEKPERVLDRHRFLYTKMKHREAAKHILYIGKIHLMAHKGKICYKEDCSEKNKNNRMVIAASPQLGNLDYVFFIRQEKEYLTKWIQEKIEPELPRESVVIFEENLLGSPISVAETINSFSSKEQMINYLKSKDTPYDPTMHRAELYKLVKLHKATYIGDIAEAEEILRANGHITMRNKKANLYGNYFDPFWMYLTEELNAKLPNQRSDKMYGNAEQVRLTANVIIQKTPIEFWKKIDDILLKKEQQIYREDLEMEHIIDQIMTIAKNGGLTDDMTQNLEEYSTQLAKEYFFLNENLIEVYRLDKANPRN